MELTDGNSLRVVIVPPSRLDGERTLRLLREEGLEAVVCNGLDAAVGMLEAGAGLLLLSENVLDRDRLTTLVAVLERQPSWSDLPLLLLANGNENSPAIQFALEYLNNATVLHCPLMITTLITAVRTALRARQKQYEIRRQLQVMNENELQLREVDQRRNEFIAVLAHELRNPLAPLRTGLDLMGLVKDEPGVFDEVRGTMSRQLTHVVRLVDDLMDSSRLARGKLSLHLERIELQDVIRDAMQATAGLMTDGRHHFEESVPDQAIICVGDHQRLVQVFSNLLSNAARYTPEGGQIRLGVAFEASVVTVSVSDNGHGIPPELHDQIFESFSQLSHPGSRKNSGLGLGLALVKQLVTLHGGQVFVESAGSGQGSVFYVRLPLAEDGAERLETRLESQPGGPPPNPQSACLKVLVVDDNRNAADLLAVLLSRIGDTVGVAYGGKEALVASEKFGPHVVFLDLGMPDLDGYSVAQRLTIQRPRPVLVALSGYSAPEDLQRSGDAGFDHHLVKPATLSQIVPLLESIRRLQPPTSPNVEC